MVLLQAILPLLSQTDREIIQLYYIKKVKQRDLAVYFGVSQPAIHYRIVQAFNRLRFLASIPQVTEEELHKCLSEALKDENGVANPKDVTIMIGMWQTWCQSKVARTLGVSQGFVRHHFLRSVKRIRAKALEDSRFQPYATIFNALSIKNFSVLKF